MFIVENQGISTRTELRSWLPLFSGIPMSQGGYSMLTDDNKALVQRFYEEVINQKNLAALDQFIAPNAINHTVPSGLPQGPNQFLTMHLNAFPDMKVTVEDLLADGDKVVALVSI